MSKQYSIKEITIERTPGFPRGRFPRVQGLSKALNVIWGLNGIGKTSLGKALRSMIWKKNIPDNLEAIALIGSDDDDEWRSTVQQSTVKQTRLADNQQMSLPGRNDEMSDSYWFSLSDFLSSDDKTKPFHKIIYSEMQGGVDIEKSANEAGSIKKFSPSSQQVTKEAKQAKDEYKNKKHNQEKVNILSSEIRGIEKEIAEENQLKKRIKLLETASEMSKTLSNIEQAERDLGRFAPQINKVTTYSYSAYGTIKYKFDDRIGIKNKIKEEIKQKISQLRECAVSNEYINDISIIERLDEMVSNLDERSRNAETSSRELRQAEAALKVWDEEHQWLVSNIHEGLKLAPAVEILSKISMNFEPVRCRLSAQKSYMDLLGEEESDDNNKDLLSELRIRMKDLMDQYISFESILKGVEFDPKAKRQSIIFSAVVTLISLLLGVVINPLLLLLALAIPIGLFRLLPSRKSNTAIKQEEGSLNKTLGQLNEKLRSIGLSSVDELNLSALSTRLTDIDAHIRQIEQTVSKNQERRKAKNFYEQARIYMTRLCAEWEAACKSIGIDPSNPRLENSLFFHFSPHLLNWMNLIKDIETRKVSFDETTTSSDNIINELKAILKSDSDGLIQIKSEARSLATRVQRAINLIEEIKCKNEELKTTDTKIAEIEVELEQFWEKVGLSPSDEMNLKELSEQREKWDSINLTIKNNKEKIESIKNQNPDVPEICAEYTGAEIVEQIVALEVKLSELEGKYKDLMDKKTEYNQYTEGSSLAESEVRYRQALEKLERTRQHQVLGRTIEIFATMLEKNSEYNAIPEVLKHASTWLEKITANRYQLRVDKHDFIAYDTVQKMNLSLDEISDGTRVQLLFAVRMGFITVQELSSDIRLPIFMDELLANSDDERALTIIHAVKEIASERQVFYFTAQADEVEKFKRHAKDVFNEVQLSNLFKDHKTQRHPLIPYIHTEEPHPEPVEDYYEYGGMLGVASADLWDSIEEMHTWNLFTKGTDLYVYLNQGRTYAGQLDLSDSILRRRFDILHMAQKLAHIGRSRPLTMNALEDSQIGLNPGAAYWNQIHNFLTEHDSDGNMLVEALEQGVIKRLIEHTKQNLIEWLEEHDYVNSDSELKMEEILKKLIAKNSDLSMGSEDYSIVERYLHQVIG